MASKFYTIICIMMLVSCLYSNPVKLKKRGATDDDCYGTDCYFDPDETDIEVKFPENLTDAKVSALPNIDSQMKIVALLNQTLASSQHQNEDTMALLKRNERYLENLTTSINTAFQSHHDQIKNLTSTMTVLLSNVFNILQNQLNVLETGLAPMSMERPDIVTEELYGGTAQTTTLQPTVSHPANEFTPTDPPPPKERPDIVAQELSSGISLTLQRTASQSANGLTSADPPPPKERSDIVTEELAGRGGTSRTTTLQPTVSQPANELATTDPPPKKRPGIVTELSSGTSQTLQPTASQPTNGLTPTGSTPPKERPDILTEELSSRSGTSWTTTLQPTVSHPANGLTTDPPPPKDCQDLAARGHHESGTCTIYPPDGLGSMEVFCDMDTDGCEWTVFQRRLDGTEDFDRDWYHYEHGFGDTNGEYWLGLQNIRRLISQEGTSWILRIDLEAFNSDIAYAVYDSFTISDAASNYTLSVGTYSGNAGDSLQHSISYWNLDGTQFSTYDRDNDLTSVVNCALISKGGWWYKRCHAANLNAQYLGSSGIDDWRGMVWFTWKEWQHLKKSEMKIRRLD
ncbi:uncharacterized protein [Amphiura filiformis]|uniref:uncharacterized protein n=1 Tax=Amphiura filiformis TaxID=82378 RepID=UPI003B21B2A1